MFRLVVLLMVVAGVSGCTQGQRFALLKNARLDECAMKRMSETKISGNHGYLQAHGECHTLVNVQKMRELDLVRSPEYGKMEQKDPLEEYASCWEFVKGLYIDKHYPDMKLPEINSRNPMDKYDGQKQLEARNSQVRSLPRKLSQVNHNDLIEIGELMAESSVISHRTLCSLWDYQELVSIMGREAHQRHPHGFDRTVSGGFK